MRIQFLSGGLGNEIREYVFARFIERRSPGEVCFFDDSWFTANPDRDPEVLESIFGVKLNVLSRYFDKKSWSEIIRWKKKGIDLPQVFLNIGIPITVVKQSFTGRRFDGIAVDHCGFRPEIAELPYSNIYYDSYWPEDQWFTADKEENQAELRFPPLKDAASLTYASQIAGCWSVGIHVRRGDFLTLGWTISPEEYKKSCQQVLDAYPDARFFIFSDDLEWCQENRAELGFDLARDTVYVSGNMGDRSYIDMQLLSMCRGIIRPVQSSFSQVAALFDQNLEMEWKLGKIYSF